MSLNVELEYNIIALIINQTELLLRIYTRIKHKKWKQKTTYKNIRE